ncbi:MAG: phosphoribosylglycinamide formyltransferase [Bacteroidota bacterium]
MKNSDEPVRIAIFASGKGSNAQNICSHFKSGKLAKVSLILTQNPHSGVFDFAPSFRVPVLLLSSLQYPSGEYLVGIMERYRIDLIILAGYLKKIPEKLIVKYPNRILNIHPSLLPAFGGKGMYGSRVHQAVLNAGEKESGITIHYVNEVYDKGEIVFQRALTIDPEWDVSDLQHAIHQLEHSFFPQVIENICKNIQSQENFS